MSVKRTSMSLYRIRLPDLETQGFAPEYIPTAAEQRIMLFTYIIKSFGISFALLINAITFMPFFLFGILPAFFSNYYYPTPPCTPLGPSDFTRQQERDRGIFSRLDHRELLIPDAEISPLLLSADTSSTDFAPLGHRAAMLRESRENLPPLPVPKIIYPATIHSTVRSTVRPDVYTRTSQVSQDLQLHVSSNGYTSVRSVQDFTRSDGDNEDLVKDQVLYMKNLHPVDSLEGTPMYSCGHASGVNICGHGQIIKREKSADKQL